jgi:metal-responsive CopG/Arc/MetJ family transcriptional regulator
MPASKVAISIDEEVLKRLDRLVEERKFPSRSKAIQEAVEEKLQRLDRTRLARESAKLDPVFEQKLADEALAGDFEEWPKY